MKEGDHLLSPILVSVLEYLPEAAALIQVQPEKAASGKFTLVEANHHFFELAGFFKEELPHHNLMHLLSLISGNEMEWEELLLQMQNREEKLTQKSYFHSPDRWLELHAIPVESNRVLLIFRETSSPSTFYKRQGLKDALKRERTRLFSILAGLNGLIYVADMESYEILYANRTLIKSLGKNPTGEKCYRALQNYQEPCSFCTNHIIKDLKGKPYVWEHYNPMFNRTYRLSDRVITWSDGRKVRLELAVDITDYKGIEAELDKQNNFLEALFKNSTDAILLFDSRNRIINVNRRFTELFGYTPEEVMGREIDEVLEYGKKGSADRELTERVLQGSTVEAEGVRYTREGKSIEVAIKGIPVVIEGKLQGGYGIYTDITAQKRFQEQLKYLSTHDRLTGLYNRDFFEEELSRLELRKQYPYSVISSDLDGLKLVNDTLGHHRGDQLLQEFANILRRCVRKSDILARMGGDEFAILLPHTGEKEAKELMQHLYSRMEDYNHKNSELPLSVSLGSASTHGPHLSLQETYKKADNNMYQDKLLRSSSARSQLVNALMATLSERDFLTEGHAHRLENLCRKIGERLGLNERQLADLSLLARVHDLGKVGVPDYILFKKGSLNQEERKLMQQHTQKGYRIAVSSPGLSAIADLILKHHERWDGSGYPLGLKGEDIPVECRILALVDAFDAMTNDRPYRKAMPLDKALQEIADHAGTQFDPALVCLFLKLAEEGEVLHDG